MTDAELRQQCHTVLPGHRQPTPAETFAAMAAWCEANSVAHDTYGDGALLQQFGVAQRGEQLLASYQEAAVRGLQDIHNPSLKGLLRRLIGKIFRVEIQGWCSEFEARNAASSEAVA